MTPAVSDQANPGLLDHAPISGRQLLVLAAAIILAALDGYDALSMAFVAPALSHDWQLGKSVLGLLLSSGLVGMAIGSLALSPIADTVGRRPVVLGGLMLMTIGSLLSAFASSVVALLICRVATGIGIGVMVAMTTLISAEFANQRRRSIAVAAVATIGFPLGSVIGGLAAAWFLRGPGWPWVFLAGAIASGLLLVVLAIFLPESPAYLAARQPTNALARLNKVLSALKQPTVAALPPAPVRQRIAYRALFQPDVVGSTLRLIAINLLVATAAFYLLNWLPQLVADMGFPPATGSFVSAVSGVVGLFGGVTFGAIAARIAPPRLIAATILGLALALVAIGLTPPIFALLLVAACCFGLFLSATTGVFYGFLAGKFPPLMRASGIGLVMGVGRIASALGPALAGAMFAHGWSRAEVSLAYALGPVIAAVLMLSFASRDPRPGATSSN